MAATPRFSDGGVAEVVLRTSQWGWEEPPEAPRLCKHDLADCEDCGMSARRDVRHRTVGGRGVVGRIGR